MSVRFISGSAGGSGISFFIIEDTHGRVGVGIIPTADMTIQAGSSAAGSAPLKLTSGPLLATPEAGAIEFLTDDLYITQATNNLRRTILWDNNPLPTRIFS